MYYEDFKVLADVVNTKYGYYEQHGKGKESEVIKEIITEFMQTVESFEIDKEDGLKLFNF